jgi:hypothetical protein
MFTFQAGGDVGRRIRRLNKNPRLAFPAPINYFRIVD